MLWPTCTCSIGRNTGAYTLLEHDHCDMSIVVVTMQQKTYILLRCVKFFYLEYIEVCE